MQITIKVDTADAIGWFGRLSDQMPYATERALNQTANSVQKEIRLGIKERFTLRREDFILRTVKIEKGNRATKANPQVIVGIDRTRDVLAKFEDGGTKAPIDGSHIAIPINVRRSKTDIIPKSERPRQLLERRNVKKFATTIVRFVRGAGRSLLYVLKPAVKIDNRLRFERTAHEVIDREWTDNMRYWFDRARESAGR